MQGGPRLLEAATDYEMPEAIFSIRKIAFQRIYLRALSSGLAGGPPIAQDAYSLGGRASYQPRRRPLKSSLISFSS